MRRKETSDQDPEFRDVRQRNEQIDDLGFTWIGFICVLCGVRSIGTLCPIEWIPEEMTTSSQRPP